MKRCMIFLILCSSSIYAKEQVVLIHGFLRSSWSMSFLGHWLKKQGYEVHNWSYPSRSNTIEHHSAKLAIFLKKLDHNEPIYFITHSMGAIVLEAALHHPLVPVLAKQGKAILLAPPHQGSSFGRSLKKYRFVRMVLGNNSGRQLLTLQPGEWESRYPLPENFDVLIFSGLKDRKVKIAESCLQTKHLHNILDCGHTFIMNRQEIKQAVLLFFTDEKEQ